MCDSPEMVAPASDLYRDRNVIVTARVPHPSSVGANPAAVNTVQFFVITVDERIMSPTHNRSPLVFQERGITAPLELSC